MPIYHFVLILRDMFFIFEFLSISFCDISARNVKCTYSDEENIAHLILKEPNKFSMPAVI